MSIDPAPIMLVKPSIEEPKNCMPMIMKHERNMKSVKRKNAMSRPARVSTAHLGGHSRWDRRPWRRVAQAPEAAAGRPEPPGAA